MIPETALRLAGPGSVLVARPTGVAHVYTGPLTPSGRFVPRSARTVCRAHTRRLTVLQRGERPSALVHRDRGRVLCTRCSVCLSTAADRQAEHQPRITTRTEYRLAYAAATPLQLAHDAEAAQTADELDHVAHLTLVLYGQIGCQTTTVTRPTGSRTLHQVIGDQRRRFLTEERAAADARDAEHQLAADSRRRADRADLHQAREERITRVGFVNATRKPGGRR